MQTLFFRDTQLGGIVLNENLIKQLQKCLYKWMGTKHVSIETIDCFIFRISMAFFLKEKQNFFVRCVLWKLQECLVGVLSFSLGVFLKTSSYSHNNFRLNFPFKTHQVFEQQKIPRLSRIFRHFNYTFFNSILFYNFFTVGHLFECTKFLCENWSRKCV